MDPKTNEIYKVLITSLIFMTVLLTLLLVSLVRQIRKRLSTYREQVNREIELIDQERNRISADLHDELGSGLSAVGLFIRQAAESADSPQLQKALKHLQTQQKKIREISHDLVPRTLETHGIARALEELYEEIREAGKIKIIVMGSLDAYTIQPAKTLHLFRIIREILMNAVKHSSASMITISFDQKRQWQCVDINDNGSGFNSESQGQNKKGDGLKNVEARIDLLGGTVNIISEKNKGTTYRIRIPINTIALPNGTE